MERNLFPTVAAGQNVGLGFYARSVKITSGANFVTIQPWGYVIPPGFTNVVYPIPTAVETASFDVTAPPAGTTPIGPGTLPQTALTYSDQQLPASGGVASQAQTVATLEQSVSTGSITLLVGLAKNITVAIYNPNALAQNFQVARLILGNFITHFVFNLASDSWVDFAYGQGTVSMFPGGAGNPNVPVTWWLPQQIFINNLTGNTLNVAIRLTY